MTQREDGIRSQLELVCLHAWIAMSTVIDDSQALWRVVLMDEFGELLEQARLPAK